MTNNTSIDSNSCRDKTTRSDGFSLSEYWISLVAMSGAAILIGIAVDFDRPAIGLFGIAAAMVAIVVEALKTLKKRRDNLDTLNEANDALHQNQLCETLREFTPEEKSKALSNSQPDAMRDIEDRTQVVCQITIGAVDKAPDPYLPSHFFPGCGSDGAEFSVTGGAVPSKDAIAEMLQEWDDDCYLIRYDSLSGKGYFTMIDCSAPDSGTVISLSTPQESGL